MPRKYDGETKVKAMRSVIDHAQGCSSGYEAISAVAGRVWGWPPRPCATGGARPRSMRVTARG